MQFRYERNDILRVEYLGNEAYKTIVHKRLSANFHKHIMSIVNKNKLKLARENQKKALKRLTKS